MNPKMLAAGVAGGLTLFVMGFVFYVLLLSDFFTTDVARDPPTLYVIVIGEVLFGILIAWVFSRSGTSTLADGAVAGAILGFLIALGFGLIMYGATTITDLTHYLADSVVYAIRWAVAGAVVGWSLGSWASDGSGQADSV